MATDTGSPQREPTPSGPALPTSIPQKRVLEDDHSPAVSSPLNPEVKSTSRVQIQMPEEGQGPVAREKRTKKDSLKKRESKGTAGSVADNNLRATPDRKVQKELGPGEIAPLRYKLARPKPSDFEQSRGPVFTAHHEVQDLEGRTIEFLETSEQ
jgi:COMPASS component BRE2